MIAIGTTDVPQQYWLDDFDAFVQTQNRSSTGTLADPSGSFPEELGSFLADPVYNDLYRNQFVLNETSGEVLYMQEPILIGLDLVTTTERVRFLQAQRRVTVNHSLNDGISSDEMEHAFMFGGQFPFLAHFQVLHRELVISLSCSVIGVGLVSLLLLPHVGGAILSVAIIVMVDIELIGMMHITGYTLNSLTYLVAIMAIGLVADHVMHVIYAFLLADGLDRDERVGQALSKIGGSVFLGGASSFVGILALAFADGEAFTIFFVMLITMISLGMLNGLVLSPVLLSVIGPQSAMSGEIGNSRFDCVDEEHHSR